MPFCDRKRDGFVGRTAIVAQGQGGDAAGVDNALDAGAFCLLHHDARAVHIGGKNLAGVACPQPIIGCHVKDVADTGHGAAHRRCIAHVAGGELQIESIEMKARTAGAHQRSHR